MFVFKRTAICRDWMLGNSIGATDESGRNLHIVRRFSPPLCGRGANYGPTRRFTATHRNTRKYPDWSENAQ